ncbi:sn1-specific diacylglycerol lipase beta-like [Vigna unguiculata]|uniref:sn1-specific diacylglycerol lipase beta-like n=1 Tax=Vigna unguiculata TaxID=3917 RepID=UPI001015D0B8|nr:sn1-specific diacylglycerol lipase beta-like [Vigna unguiculata]
MTVRRNEPRALKAPKNRMGDIPILAEAIMLCYTQRRYIFNSPRAIAHAVLDKSNKTIGSECRERSDCAEVKGREILKDLYELKRLLRHAMLFSSPKRYLAFLFPAGFEGEDVLQRERTSGFLRPAFTVIRDKESKCLVVFIRGTRSIKDIVTDALCAPVPFNHSMVSGHAHCGMAASADWISKRCIPVLLEALRQYPHFKIKIVGHSLGGGTAALLTYKLREIQQLSSATCVTFGPAACMTLELAEFGKPFITSIINGSDTVPTLSASSVHDFIDEGRNKDKNILDAVGTGFSLAKAIAEHAVNCCTEVVKKHKHSLFHRENIRALSENLVEASGLSGTSFEPLLSEEHLLKESIDDDEYNFSSEGYDNDDSDDDNENEDQLLNEMGNLELRKPVYIPDIHAKEKDIIDETSARRRLYPPGKIMHMITSHMSENSNSNQSDADEKHVCLYRTPTQLYEKLRFSRGMILDHRTKRYMKKLQQLINKLEKEQFKYRGG